MDPDQHHNALNQGDRLHWYEVRSILGQGGFGITYLVEDTNLGRQFAIKEYLPSEFSTRDASSTVQPISENHADVFNWGKQRFLDEARTLAQFEHPNIVRVHSFFEHFNTGYMVMEYEEGQDFSELIKAGEFFDEERLLGIILPILDGLEKVHAQGFVHRDIKPQNIFIRQDGSPVLIDFGSARQAIGGQTRTMTSLVTPGYAPFEQYHDAEGKQGPWTDIYALGATLYCAITGKPPCDALKRGQARVEHNTDAYLSLVDIKADVYSEAFLRAIDHALGFLPADRPASVAEWMQMLRGELAVPEQTLVSPVKGNDAETVVAANRSAETEVNATTGPVDPQPIPPPSAPQAKGRLPMIGIGALLLILAGTGWFMSQQSDPSVESAEAELARLQAELDAKSAQLKQAELEKLQAELEEKARQLEQAEQQRLAEVAKQAEAERKRQEQARLAEEKAAQEKLAKQQAALEAEARAREQAEQAERERQAKLAREKAEKEQRAKLAREQAEKKKQAEIARQKLEQEKLAKLEAEQERNSSATRSVERELSGTYATEVTTNSGKLWVFGKRSIVEVRLKQSGNQVVGEISGDKSGGLEGTRNKNEISFVWYLTDSGAGSTEGRGTWIISPDGNLIEGNWRSSHYDSQGDWRMLRLETSTLTASKEKTGQTDAKVGSVSKNDFSGRYASEISFDTDAARYKKFTFGHKPAITVNLEQTGSRIVGTFEGSRGGEIEGEVTDQGIEFDWYITSGGNAIQGTGKWQLRSDHDGMLGSWNIRVRDWNGDWNLTKIGGVKTKSESGTASTATNIGSWTGTYDATVTGKIGRLGLKEKKFRVELVQNGNDLSGTFGEQGKVWGTISGDKIKFEWSAGKINTGDGVWTISSNEKLLYGNWYDWNENGSWTMTRVK